MEKEKIDKEEFIKVKHKGKIFTPDYLVEIILNQGHYISGNILEKHVIDNSCGDGQFLIHIVDRYCKNFLKESNNTKKLKRELEKYIHGIDIDSEDIEICKERCNKVARLYNVQNVEWDFIVADTLKTDIYDKKMDYVLGNPPYVRTHNLEENADTVKQYSFGNGGMTDLYIVFYEKGLRMLKRNGKLCYITPSSFFTSVAGTNMRRYIANKSLLESVCDLKHFQPFTAMTYTAIVCLNKSKKQLFAQYSEFDENDLKPIHISNLQKDEYIINDNFYFSTKRNINLLKNILNNKLFTDVEVKNGYATLSDKVFINDFDFESQYIIPVLKGSRGTWGRAIYPYNENGKLIPENIIKKDKRIYEYLLKQKEELGKRSCDNKNGESWYAYGRTQALNDTYKDKIGINTLIKKDNGIKIEDVPPGTGIYSGLYILSNSYNSEEIKQALRNSDFEIFISLLGKYKSGGYYTFSSKDVKKYLDYKLKGVDVMTENDKILNVIRESFKTYLNVGTSRSTAKLKSLHGHIANDLKNILGEDYNVKSQGIGDDREGTIEGKYYPKKVDITIYKENKPIAGYAVKFVMRNYSQNSNNYFENMLGETANIRMNSISYFQIFIIFDKVPYYKSNGVFSRYDIISQHNLDKYIALSNEDPNVFYHTPDKTLLLLVKLKEKEPDYKYTDSDEYADYYKSVIEEPDLLSYSDKHIDNIGEEMILNDYEKFIKETYNIIVKENMMN